MKVICSEGGPLIGLDRRIVPQWSGSFGKRFIGDQSPFRSDYEAVCYLINGINNPIRRLAKFPNPLTEGFILAIPIETAVVSEDPTSILLAQVEAAEEDWSFSDIAPGDFDQAHFDEGANFMLTVERSEFMIFDSAQKSESIGDDFISVSFSGGRYQMSSAEYKKDDATELNLFKMELMESHSGDEVA